MKKTLSTLLVAVVAMFATSNVNADIISEFLGNPPGSDPGTQDIELEGTANLAFDLWLVSIESDPGPQGTVDRATNVTGTYDANGRAVVSVGDLENPSFTLVLATNFTGAVGATDVDTNDDGIADDISAFTGVMDAIAVIEDTGDPGYGSDFGGLDFTANGNSSDPVIVFRDGTTSDWYATDPNGEVYDLAGNQLMGTWDLDPFTTTFGSVNPTFTAIPEPAGIAVLGMLSLVAVSRRKR